MSKMQIFIPSRSRARLLKTPSQLPGYWRGLTHIVVPAQQEYDYRFAKNNGLKVLPCPVEGIPATRQWIMDYAFDNGMDKVFMLDDDMTFCRRVPNWVYEKNAKLMIPSARSPDEVGSMLDKYEEWLSHHVCVGISSRQGNNNAKDRWFRLATRMNNAYGFNMERFQEAGLRFDRVLGMEDFDITLQMLTQGIANKVDYDWCWNQFGSGSEGGCSDYRTFEAQTRDAEKLHSLWPDFVELVVKRGSGKGIYGQPRTDVRIAWRKAYNGQKL